MALSSASNLHRNDLITQHGFVVLISAVLPLHLLGRGVKAASHHMVYGYMDGWTS
jgi:hypothetical protein